MSLRTAKQQQTLRAIAGKAGKATWEQRQARKQEEARGRAVGLDLHSHLFRHRRIADVVETCGDKIGQQFAHHQSLQSTSGYGRHANNVAHDVLRMRADIDRMGVLA